MSLAAGSTTCSQLSKMMSARRDLRAWTIASVIVLFAPSLMWKIDAIAFGMRSSSDSGASSTSQTPSA